MITVLLFFFLRALRAELLRHKLRI